MIVYRIEDRSNGYGPFHTYGIDRYNKAATSDNLLPHQHPLPHNDGIPTHSHDYYFGFISLGQLEDWFPDEEGRRALQDKGRCQLSVYDVPNEYVKVGFNSLLGHLPRQRRRDKHPISLFCRVVHDARLCKPSWKTL